MGGGGSMRFDKEITTPPFVDLHVHYREPSPTNTSETFANGTLAALDSGILISADMPNNPGAPTHTRASFDEKVRLINESANGLVMVHAGNQPESDAIDELALMAPDAACLKLYGGKTTNNEREYKADDFRDIVQEWHRVAPESPIIFHAGNFNLEPMIEMVAGEYQHHIHIAHVNSPIQVRWIKGFKQKGYPVTCGITPHHLLMDSHDRITQGKFAEMMPPLASQYHAEQLMRLLANGDIDMIETDYAPHSFESKMHAEEEGSDCFGVPGIEHVVPQLFYQVQEERLTEERLYDAFSVKPAQLLGIALDPDLKITWNMEQFRIGENEVSSGAGWTQYMGNLAIGTVVDFPDISNRPKFVKRGDYITAA